MVTIKNALKGCKMKEEPAMIKDSTIFVGLDLGDKTSEICILDEEGEVVEESRVPTITTGLKRRFSCLPSCRAAMEVGTHSRWASQPLKEMGHEVLVANARKLRLIYENAHKGDGADAEYLAWLVRLDPKLLSP
ncbi:MAG: hypothetical protein A2W28_09530 [Gammaproteobacteria bacterium RBG_16_51_14]|nr:MAG: hypothetical protein A2W28_09530 [Gammaproteobacteria bacterium RBG_16_51_14]